jgi:hypothetical protein
MKLEDHRQAGATIQRLMAEVRQVSDAIVDTDDRHRCTKFALKHLERAWASMELARLEMEETLYEQYRHAANDGIYRPPTKDGRLVEDTKELAR